MVFDIRGDKKVNIDAEGKVFVGAYLDLNVMEYNGKLVFETQFVYYDAELDLHKEEDWNEDSWEDFADYGNFRSVRIFHLSCGEKINLQAGDKIRAMIQSSYVAANNTGAPILTKDGRRKLHITVHNARRVYRWVRFRTQESLTLKLLCGSRLAQKKVIPLVVKKGLQSDNGWVCPVVAEILPTGSILRVVHDPRRPRMISGDYRLQERQKGRTMKDLESDFLPILSYDRMIPTRERRYFRSTYT